MDRRSYFVVEGFEGDEDEVFDVCSAAGRVVRAKIVKMERGEAMLFLVFRGCIGIERLFEVISERVKSVDAIRRSGASDMLKESDAILVYDYPGFSLKEIRDIVIELAVGVGVEECKGMLLCSTLDRESLELIYHFLSVLGCGVMEHTMERMLPIAHVVGVPDGCEANDIMEMFAEIKRPIFVKVMNQEALALFPKSSNVNEICSKLLWAGICGKEVSVSQFLLTHEKRAASGNRLFVLGLPEDIEQKHLDEIFGIYGRVMSYERDGESWIVVYYENEAANKAEIALNNATVDGKAIEVFCLHRVVVRNLPSKVSEREVRKIFPRCVSIEINNNRRSKRTFVIISFKNESDALESIRLGNQTIFSGVCLKCVMESEQHNYESVDLASIVSKRNTILFHNLPQNKLFRHDDLVELCRQFGIVEDVIIPQKANNGGLAFVVFRDHNAAQRAVDSLSNVVMGDQPIFVEMLTTSTIGPVTTNFVREPTPLSLEISDEFPSQERKGLNIVV